ncbi:regulator of G-protein signaling 12 isoform X1 [Lagopus muta]|uniref:regulator of G-protein signaling 12 isoform X1 n=1 Tax=Lagopus muta TaxID=64668 RepID=UPI00209DAB16|nr:regulator of G-protein signaling 12 isoform X1 [Lagopus muta]XP_048797375.1 regulator of G-protein signaling 12 isoform X1 [Lagopus muta]
MYRPGETVKRRLNMHAPPRIRSVEIARGRAGYGFTLSGQAPCILSCVMKGSPADYVGLKAGDQIFAINEINVKKASHEDVVKLIGKCSGVLHMVIAEGISHIDSCSSDEEVGFYDGKGWLKPKPDSKALGINRAEKVVEEMQSGGIFNMIFESPNLCAGNSDNSAPKQRSFSDSAAIKFETGSESLSNPNLLSKDEISKVLNDDLVFRVGLESAEDFGLDASILNVAMIVGYLGSIELPSTTSNLENESLQAIRGCMRRLRAEQKIHSLVMMKIMHDCIQLCSDKSGVVAEYPAEKLAFSAVCPDDRRFFGLVTMQTNDDASLAQEDEGVLRTSCHVFMVDPELFHHKIHQGIARRFGLECTADPDTNGCLEFPTSSLPVLQFISVLYRDMGELIEGMRARAFLDGDADVHQNNSTSSNSDSGIGNFNQEEKNNRVLVVDLGSNPSKHIPSSIWENPVGRGQNQSAAHWNGFCHEQEGNIPLEVIQNDKSQNLNKHLGPSARIEVPLVSSRNSVPPSKKSTAGAGNQRWLPVHVLQEWQHGNASDQESYTDSTDGWSSVNCGTLPPPMSKIPADRYRVDGSFGQPQLKSHKNEWSKKMFCMQNKFGLPHSVRKSKEDKKGAKFGRPMGLNQAPPQRSSVRRSFGRSKRFSITRSLDDLESATVSDGELNSADLKDCISENSLSSNASLPSVQSCRRLRERRVASWAVSFERLLQDPVGVKYFSEFLRKEFSEENILFWQACEYFNHVPAHDKKELSYRAREIFSKFLCSKATTPVNIDSQAQLADDILNSPHPDMFKEQQLQIFNLMKFDSYTRFLKSPLYQECILAEVEGRTLPDPQRVPSSPTSKHSISSEKSNISTPKKLSGKSKSGRSLNEESGEEDTEKKKRGTFFSWSRSKSLGKSQKRKENGDYQNDSIQSNGLSYRRESQGSMSSTASLDLSEASRLPAFVPDKEKSPKYCCVNLPDGSSSKMAVKSGFSIKEVLSGLCEKHGINIAAVDLFLVGGDKPLVLHQDSSILESRDLRLEKRTLFRLDLVPINRSVGLKAKPTKPVTEVLRPVVAKYGLNLNELVARLNGEQEPLDLGVPISNLDGQRVILDEKEPTKGRVFTDKQKGASVKQSATVTTSRNQVSTGEGRTLGKSNSIKMKGENGKNAREVRLSKREESIAKIGKKKCQKINLDEAEEFFELISKAQSNRADDQRGLLRKEDLILPDFLRLPPTGPEPSSSTPIGPKGLSRQVSKNDEKDGCTSPSGKQEPIQSYSENSVKKMAYSENKHKAALTALHSQKSFSVPFNTALSPIPHAHENSATIWKRQSRELQAEGIQMIDDENVADLTLVAEGDISSPNSTLLPPPPEPSDVSKPTEANYPPPTPSAGNQEKSGFQRSNSGANHKKRKDSQGTSGNPGEQTSLKAKASRSINPAGVKESLGKELPVNRIIDVDGVKLEDTGTRSCDDSEGNLSLEGYISELRSCQGRMRTGVYRTSDLPSLIAVKSEKSKGTENQYKATFV